MHIRCLLPLLACGLLLPSRGQEARPEPSAGTAPSLSVTAKLVVVPTVVRDKHGALVTALAKEDFDLHVDGAAQPVRYFDHSADLPLTLGLLVDSSRSQRTVLDDERAASITFLQKMLVPERDKAFVIEFAGSVDLLQDVTNSRAQLQEALRQVDVGTADEGGGRDRRRSAQDDPDAGRGGDPGDAGGRGRYRHGGGTALYDAVFLASTDVKAKQGDRRALVVLTDGDDNGSMETLAKAIEAAQRADTTVYAIYYKGSQPWQGGGGRYPFPGGGGPGGGGPGGGGGRHGGGYGREQVDGKKVLQRMCGETGGRVFEVSRKETVEKIYGEIGDELRSSYRLGFTPTADRASQGYHQVSLALTGAHADKKDDVQTRDGYYMR